MTQVAERPAPMAAGGAWICKKNGETVYATHEEHVKRLLAEGGQIVPDPRDPSAAPVPSVPVADLEAVLAEKERIQRELEELKARMTKDFEPPVAKRR